MPEDTSLKYGGVSRLPGDTGYQESLDISRDQRAYQEQPTEDYGQDVPDSDRTYFENPQKLAEWHTMYQTAKSNPSMKVPDGIPFDQIEQAYKYYETMYPGVPVAEWKPPKENDPLRSYLKQIPQIPIELLPPADRAEWEKKIKSVNQTADASMKPIEEANGWSKLDWDAKLVEMGFNAGANPQLADRPEWTRAPATIVNGFMAGLLPGVAIGVINPIAGAVAFLGFGGIAAYQAYTGERVPLISDFYDKFQIPAKALEAGIGSLSLDLTPQERMNNILPNMVNVVEQLVGGKENAMMAAGRQKYESSAPVAIDTLLWSLDTAYNLGVETAGLFGGGWKKMQIKHAGEGYKWDFDKGINDPVKIEGNIGDAYLQEVYDKLSAASPENFDKVLEEIDQETYDRFGFSGAINDLAGQMLLDPLNFVPFLEGLGTAKVAKIFKKMGVAPETMGKIAGAAERSMGNPLIDVMPIGVQQVVEMITRGKGDKPDFKPFGMDIGAFGKRSASSGLIGTIEAAKREIRSGNYFGAETPTVAAKLSKSSQTLANLTQEGKFKELEPIQHLPETGVSFFEKQKNRWINFQRDMFNMTPEAQGLFAETTLKDNLQIMAKEYSNSPEDVVRNIELLSHAGDSDRVQQTADAINSSLNTPEEIRTQKQKEALVGSPTAATVADSLDYGVKNVGPMLETYRLADGNRANLDGLSKLIGEKPADIVKRVMADPEAFFKEISLKPGVTEYLTKTQLASPDELKTHFGVFTGKDGVALNSDEFTAKYINAITDKAGEYLVKKYNIKPQSKVMQTFGLMKDVQSLLVLGLNPGYFINNMLNNIVSRAAQGVFGFHNKPTEDAHWNRKGYSPSRLNTGIGASGEGTDVGGMSAISRAVLDKGAISNMRRQVKGLAHKISLFQKLSQQIEMSESNLAYTIGDQIMHHKLAKMDVGYDRLPANVEKAMREKYPGLLERVYAGVEGSLNMDEIRAVVNAEFIPVQVNDVFNKVVDEIYADPDNPAKADTVRDLIKWIGIEKDFEDALTNTKTPEAVDDAVNKVKAKLQENIDEKLYDSIVQTAEEVKNMTQAEGTLAIVNIKAKMDEWLSKRYLDHFKHMSDANVKLKDATFEQSMAFRKDLNDQESKRFRQDYAKEKAVYAGLVGSGISDGLVNTVGKLSQLSDDFFTTRNMRYNEVFENAAPGAEWNRRYQALQEEMDARYMQYNEQRTLLLNEFDTKFYNDLATRNPDPVRKKMLQVIKEWRTKVMELETKRQGEMESIRKKLIAQGATGLDREKAWGEFHTKYDPLVMQITDTNNLYANQIAAIYKRATTIFDEDHWVASTPENSTGFLTKEEIQQVMAQGLSPEQTENYANALVKSGKDVGKYIEAEPIESRDYLQKVVDRINIIRSYLTKERIEKIHNEQVKQAQNNSPISIQEHRSKLREYAKQQFGINIGYGDRYIKNIVKSYTGLDIPVTQITPELWQEALLKRTEAHRAKSISPDASQFDQRFKLDSRGNNIENEIKPVIISKAEILLREFQAGRNGERLVVRTESGEVINSKNVSTNAPWYQYLYDEGRANYGNPPARSTIENALKSIIKDPTTAKGKWVDYLMGVIYDNLSGTADNSVYSSFDPYANWIMGNKSDVAAFFDEYLQNIQSISELAQYIGGNEKIANEVADYSYRWASYNTRTEPWFTDNGRPNPQLLNAAVDWTYEEFRQYLDQAFQKQEMLEGSGLSFKDGVYYFDDKPVADATPGTKIEGVNGTNYQLLGYDVNDPTKLVVHLPNENKVITIDQTRPEPAQPTGSTPPGKSPGALDHFEVNNEINAKILEGALDQFGERFKQENQTQIPGIGTVDPETLAEIQAWINRIPTQLASINLAAQRHGEMMRDGALLNYSMRYGVDNYLTALFPYQFWYTRTMMQWGKRMIDRPAWFAMYARLKEMQERTASKGIPTRFAGKMRAYAPWLPEWAGTGMFSDPLSQAFPLEIYTNLGETMQYQISSIDRETQQNLLDLVDNAQITREQYDAAMANKNDPLYVNAYEEARKKSDMYNPVSLASMMMQPSMWVMDANYLASGTPEKISVLPITKTSRAVGTALKGTPLEALGNMIEALGAGPETSIRKAVNLSPYGTWGDYYIDRELANLVAEGKYTATDVMISMIDRKGDAYTAAEDRVRTQDMYKVPLATVLNNIAKSLTDTGKISSIGPSLLSSAMPFSVLPEGEMIQRGLAVEYKKAWDMTKAGDLKAINKFFEEHPEYQARLAMNKDPDERLKQLLIDQIWNQYNQIPSANKRQVADGLGDKFQTNFLNTATHDYETIDIPTLAYWSQALGGQVPDKAGKLPQYQMPKIETYTPEMTKAITDYKNEKNKLFPMVDLQQQMYFDKGSDKSVLAAFPQIKEYWDWKKKYEASHPVLKSYFAANREAAKEPEKPAMEPYNPGNYALTPEQMKLFSPSLVKMIVSDITAKQKLGEGAIASLRLIWENQGKPDGTLENWYNNKVKPTFGK